MFRRSSRLFGVLALVSLALPFAARTLGAQEVLRVPFQPGPDFVGWVEDAFVLELRPGTRPRVERQQDGRPRVDVPALQRLLDTHRVQGFEALFPAAKRPAPGAGRPDLTGYYRVTLPAGGGLEAALAAFAADPTVQRAERIGKHALNAEPKDPKFQC